MAIASTDPVLEESVGGEMRRLQLGNGEIERFEVQYAPFGIFELYDQLFGRGTPQVRHVRDLIALGLVGGGLTSSTADSIVSALPPSENLELRLLAQRLLGVTFMPSVLKDDGKKSKAGSRAAKRTSRKPTTPAAR